ncbi:MAG: hypothetical protein ACHQ0I_01405 [Candidatus Lutacidiplasmatales archaeon]
MRRFRSSRPISATELIARRFRMIRIDRSQGARALAVQALEEVASLARGWSHDPPETLPYALRQTAAALEQAQPAMGPFLRWAHDLRGLAQSGPPNSRLRKAQH